MLRRLRIENLVLIREAELELAPGLVALTGETGAGKTIFTQAIGLLLGSKGDAGLVGAAGSEAYVEAEIDVPEGFFDEEGLEALHDLRPVDEPGLVEHLRQRCEHLARLTDEERVTQSEHPLALHVRQQVMAHVLLVKDRLTRRQGTGEPLDHVAPIRIMMLHHLVGTRVRQASLL